MSKGNIDQRLLDLIENTTSPAKRFKELEEKTGISSNRWQSVWHKRQRAMPDMIEVICRLHPEFAFWLATGIADSAHGHHKPIHTPGLRMRTAARELFLAEMELTNWIKENEFSFDDWTEYLQDEYECTDEQVVKKAKAFSVFNSKIDQLTTIRDEQEASLRKHEVDTFLKEFLE